MATLVRKLFKIALFIGLFFLAVRYVHTYPLPMTEPQQHVLFVISDAFGVEDVEMLYILSMTAIDLMVAIIAYKVILKLWRRYRMRRGSVRV
ncbi:hypothetical protein IAG25_21850 [Caballeronia sp. EK]|uniref:hypothetical protein n=1 Tax=Caballeronia sp. EK TaxID=2767469 RepID=UPI001654EA62|nr:hypothetical protein [Caballeronia sp. EK]MBC8639476.1 hypothetical protein [Caballeronia sp. EK]